MMKIKDEGIDNLVTQSMLDLSFILMIAFLLCIGDRGVHLTTLRVEPPADAFRLVLDESGNLHRESLEGPIVAMEQLASVTTPLILVADEYGTNGDLLRAMDAIGQITGNSPILTLRSD